MIYFFPLYFTNVSCLLSLPALPFCLCSALYWALLSSSRGLGPVWAKLLPCLQCNSIPPASSLCCLCSPRRSSPGSDGAAMASVPGSSKHEPGCARAVLGCAAPQLYWRSLQKMEIHCVAPRKNLEVSVVTLSWPNPWQCFLKANMWNLKLAERMTSLRLSWIPDLIFLIICQSLGKSIFKVFTSNLYPRKTVWLKVSVFQTYILPCFFWK